MLSCEALVALQTEMVELAKVSSFPYKKQYKLAPGAEINLSIEELDPPDNFRLTIEATGEPLVVEIEGHRKLPPLLVGLLSQKVTEYLVDRRIEPCSSMGHGGADELLRLYSCINEFKMSPELPYSSIVKGAKRDYRIFSLEQDSNHCRLELVTNHIYGDSIKTIAIIDSEALIPDQCYEMLERMLIEWFRPESVKSVRYALTDLANSQPAGNFGGK